MNLEDRLFSLLIVAAIAVTIVAGVPLVQSALTTTTINLETTP